MPANQIEYDVVVVGPAVEAVKKALTERGRRGFTIAHSRVDDGGVYTFIMSKTTGMQVEEEVAGEWVDDGFVNDETSWS